MNNFKMTGYMNKYAEANNRLHGLKAKVQNMRETLIYRAAPAAAQESIRETEAEIKRLETEVDDLYCLAHYGKHRAELAKTGTVQWEQRYGGCKPHWPGRDA